MLAWGRNDSGQLGVADTEPRQTPTRVLSSSMFVSVACGSRTTIGVTTAGSVLGWGASRTKALGEDIEDEAVTVPRGLEGLSKITQVASRGSHVVALDCEGNVFTWGRGEQDHQMFTRPTMLPFKGIFITMVGAGRMHSVAVDDSGALFTWGASDEGQTGLSRSGFVQLPTAVPNLPGPVRKISCGSRHTLIVVSGPSGGVYGFGGNSYAQLGLGDKEPRFEPTRVPFGDELENDSREGPGGIDEEKQQYPYEDLDVACGYRHSFIYSPSTVWGFGWNSNYQCSPASDSVVPFPRRLSFEGSGMVDLHEQRVHQVAAGGRHTLILFRKRSQLLFSLVSFGRAVCGELGIPRYVEDACKNPILVLTLTDPEEGMVPKVACGWEHSVMTLTGGRVSAASFTYSWLSSFKGDVDAALAQLVNCMVLLRLVPLEVQPGVGATIVLSNLLFGAWASTLDATAMPHGLNTVALFALRIGAYDVTLARHPEDTSRALRACLFCTIAIGIAQAFSAHAIAPLMKRHVPRSALAASVGGVALAFITTRFTAEIFASPRAGLPALLILIIGLGARERMPFGIPVAFVALFTGWLLSDASTVGAAGTAGPASLQLFSYSLRDVFLDTENYPLMFTVVLPLVVVNVVNNLACIEQARASGDLFRGSTGLLLDAFATVFGAVVFGCPFPTCIYVGHSSFKAMGATAWYAWLNAILISAIVFRWSATLIVIMNGLPQVAMVGVLVWIGCVVTAEAFKAKKHGVAVSIALVPSLAAWRVSAAPTSAEKGLVVLGEGYMLVSMILGSVVTHVIDRKFAEAMGWLCFASVLSYLGWIHASEPEAMAEAYFLCALVAGFWAFAQWWVGEREADLDDDNGDQMRVVGVARMATASHLHYPKPSNAPKAFKYGTV